MTDAKRLLAEATPLPWRTGIGRFGVNALAAESPSLLLAEVRPDGHHNRIFAERHEDAALIAFAVNHLPDYEALVGAVERYIAAEDEANRLADSDDGEWLLAMQAEKRESDNLHAALSRLRDKVPA